MRSSGQMWTITSYYNPARYRRRLENFRHFRSALRCRLLVVELGYGDEFELSEDDADILLRLRGESVLWQKERLLNVALGHLPAYVSYVAWVDCDVVFSEPSWTESAVDALQHYPMVQLFENLIDLGPASTHHRGEYQYAGKSMASSMVTGESTSKAFTPTSTTLYRPSHPGSAWAAPRSLLAKHGFYDALILGGGDGAFALAAYGRFEQLLHVAKLNRAQARHYLDWARPFFQDVRGHVGFIDGNLIHYWHGELADRSYTARHEGLMQFDFDPYVDIEVDNQGCYRWSSDKPGLHDYVKNYWRLRKEDGR